MGPASELLLGRGCGDHTDSATGDNPGDHDAVPYDDFVWRDETSRQRGIMAASTDFDHHMSDVAGKIQAVFLVSEHRMQDYGSMPSRLLMLEHGAWSLV